MFFILLAAIITIVAVVLAVVCANDDEAPSAWFPVGVGAVLIVLVAIPFSVATVDTGHTGLVYQFGTSGKIIGHMDSGFNTKLPWHGVRQVNTQVQAAEYDNLEGFTRETQPVNFDVTLNYRVDPSNIDELYTKVGPNWRDSIMNNRVLNDVKEAANAYLAVDVAPNRENIRKSTASKLAAELQPYGVIVSSVQVKNISFSPAFTHSIELKQQQTQAALTAQAKVKQSQAEAEQQVAIAKGDAKSTLLKATAQAEANRKLASSVTPELVQYEQALNLGKLAASGQVQLVPSNALIQVPSGK